MKAVIEIMYLSFHNFRVEEARGFFDQVISTTNRIPTEQRGTTRADFEAAYNYLTEVLKRVMASAYTKRVTIADERRDNCVFGLFSSIEANMRHFDANIAESARQIQLVLNGYKNLAKMPYSQETGAINDLLESLLSPKYEPVLGQAGSGVIEWAYMLQEANSEFSAIFSERVDDKASTHQETGTSAEAMKKAKEEYYEYIATLNALLRIQPTPELIAAAERLNEIIRYHHDTISIRKGRAKAKDEVIENGE